METLLQARRGDIAVLGAGRRAGTIRCRVRNIQHFLAWLAINYGITYPTGQAHLTEFLQVRLSEPCNRGSLKISHESFVFLDVVSGIEAQHRLTNSLDLLSQALPGKITKQAPRMFTAMLKSLEQMIISSNSPLYFRIYVWWICVQTWATLRFDDHRGLNPKDIKVDSSSFTALLTRSKTFREDPALHSRLLVIDAACYLQSKYWMLRGWRLLSASAPFERDFLLPALSTNYRGVVRSELRYAMAYAMQNRVLSSLYLDGSRIFSAIQSHSTGHLTRAGHTCLPPLSFLISQNSKGFFLRGWNAQASDRYARTARRSVINMQRAVIRALYSPGSDPLPEQDLAEHFEEFFYVAARLIGFHYTVHNPSEVALIATRSFRHSRRNRLHCSLKSWVPTPRNDAHRSELHWNQGIREIGKEKTSDASPAPRLLRITRR